MSLLAVDIGNSRIKCALFTEAALARAWTWETATAEATTCLRAVLTDCRPDRIGICSVVPDQTAEWHAAAVAMGLSMTIITGETPTPLRNRYATPATLGPDRLMAAVAAAAQAGTPVIPISLGTATVVDAVSADHEFLGGMIAPGIGTVIDALRVATAALPVTVWEATPGDAIGHDTAAALAIGIRHQQLGGLRAMIAAAREAVGAEAACVLTGGWAPRVLSSLTDVALHDPALVVRGIALTLR